MYTCVRSSVCMSVFVCKRILVSGENLDTTITVSQVLAQGTHE